MAEPIRVLHVDDDPQLLELAATFLERESDRIDIEQETAQADALDRIADGEVDCVISDYDMPGMDGIELLEEVRDVDANIPFILFTGKGSEEVASEALSKGATDYLQKASGSERYALLANRVENAVIQYRSVAELERRSEILAEAQQLADIGVLEFDVDAGEVWLSEGIYRMFDVSRPDAGGTHQDVTAEDILQHYHPEDRPAIREATERTLTDGKSRELEVRDAEDDRWFALRWKTRADEDDNRWLRVTAQDVTAQKRREQTLRRQEHRFEAVFEDPEMLVGVLDPEGRVQEVNETALSYVDAAEADLVGEHFAETPWWAEDDRDAVRAWLSQAADGEYVTYEADVAREAGPAYSAIGSIRPVTDADGRVEALVVSARDVTERKAREHELENYETIIEGLGESTFKTNAEGEQVYVNTAGADITGYDSEEILGSTGGMLYGEDEYERIEAATVDLATDPDRDLFTMESVIRTKDGEEVPVELTVTDRWGIGGEFLGTVGVVTDVSQRKAAERDLQEYESIIRAIPDEVTILDTGGTITRIIPPAGSETTVSGYRPEEIEGDPIERVVRDAHLERGTEVIEELVTTDRQRAAFEMQVVDRHGKRHWREDHLALLEDEDGSIQGTVGVLRDIEERKAYERELERQNERLEEFAEIASHDLRNPLNLAHGYVEMVAEDCDSEHVADVRRALDRMEQLIDDTLAMARQGADVTDPTVVELPTLAETCLGAVGSSGASLSVEAGLQVLADEDRLRQVIENLLRNAVEHSGRDVTVEIGTVRADPAEDGNGADRQVGFYVADDGPGVPPDERADVFEAGHTTSDDGTGFGLAIVAEICEAHGWEIDITESDAGGARFEITGVDSPS